MCTIFPIHEKSREKGEEKNRSTKVKTHFFHSIKLHNYTLCLCRVGVGEKESGKKMKNVRKISQHFRNERDERRKEITGKKHMVFCVIGDCLESGKGKSSDK